MSFILQVFHAPQAGTVAEADAAIDALGTPAPADRKRIERFIAALTRQFPNRPDDPEASAWPEGLDAGHLDDAVYVFTVNLDMLDANLMAHIAACAAAENLHVLDPQNGLLYRSDRKMIDMQGRVTFMPQPRTVALATPRSLPTQKLTPKSAVQRLDEQIRARLADAGFAADPQWGDARRMRGVVQQSVDVMVLARDPELVMAGTLGLRCRPVTGVWLKGLGGEGAAIVHGFARAGWRLPDVHLVLSLLPEPHTVETEKLSRFGRATGWQWVLEWGDRWIAWIEAEGLDLFARMETPAGMARYALSGGELQAMARRTDLEAGELLHRLVLAAVYGGARKDEWIGAILRYAAAFGDRFAREEEVVRIPDFKATIERLAAWCGTGEFEREAERLRALG